jgi:hypothetical protein
MAARARDTRRACPGCRCGPQATPPACPCQAAPCLAPARGRPARAPRAPMATMPRWGLDCSRVRLARRCAGCHASIWPPVGHGPLSSKPLSWRFRTLQPSDRVCRTDSARLCWGCQGPQPQCRQPPVSRTPAPAMYRQWERHRLPFRAIVLPSGVLWIFPRSTLAPNLSQQAPSTGSKGSPIMRRATTMPPGTDTIALHTRSPWCRRAGARGLGKLHGPHGAAEASRRARTWRVST